MDFVIAISARVWQVGAYFIGEFGAFIGSWICAWFGALIGAHLQPRIDAIQSLEPGEEGENVHSPPAPLPLPWQLTDARVRRLLVRYAATLDQHGLGNVGLCRLVREEGPTPSDMALHLRAIGLAMGPALMLSRAFIDFVATGSEPARQHPEQHPVLYLGFGQSERGSWGDRQDFKG